MASEHEEKLGYDLKCRLAQFMSGAGEAVIPPGTLGAGMGFSQDDEVEHSYDPESGILTVIGTITFQVQRQETDEP